MNPMRLARSTKNFVRNHKVAVAVVATTSVCIVLTRLQSRDFDKFLTERGIDPADYWTPDHK